MKFKYTYREDYEAGPPFRSRKLYQLFKKILLLKTDVFRLRLHHMEIKLNDEIITPFSASKIVIIRLQYSQTSDFRIQLFFIVEKYCHICRKKGIKY